MRLRNFVAILSLVSGLSATAASAVVVDSLPYPGSPDWTTVVFSGSSMGLNTPGTETTMTTGTGGVWFGVGIGGSTSGYSLGTSAVGNTVSVRARFSGDARDWNTYLADGSSIATIQYRPTDCDGNQMACYDAPFRSGVGLYFASDDDPALSREVFVALDVTRTNVFGFFLRDGQVTCRVNEALYSGRAQSADYRILVIGDGSGSTRTGAGSMMVRSVSLDTAPPEDFALSVPEPSAWMTMTAGFALVGAGLRGRRRRAVAGRPVAS